MTRLYTYSGFLETFTITFGRLDPLSRKKSFSIAYYIESGRNDRSLTVLKIRPGLHMCIDIDIDMDMDGYRLLALVLLSFQVLLVIGYMHWQVCFAGVVLAMVDLSPGCFVGCSQALHAFQHRTLEAALSRGR